MPRVHFILSSQHLIGAKPNVPTDVRGKAIIERMELSEDFLHSIQEYINYDLPYRQNAQGQGDAVNEGYGDMADYDWFIHEIRAFIQITIAFQHCLMKKALIPKLSLQAEV